MMIKQLITCAFLGVSLLFLAGCTGSKKVSKSINQSPTTEETEIRQTVSDYFDLVNQMKINESLDFMHPKFFEIVPRDLMENTFESLFTDSIMQFSFDSIRIQSVEGPVVHEDTKYARVNYLGYMGMRFLDEADEGFHAMMEPGLKMQFGYDNVTYVEEKNQYNIKKISQMIAIRGKDDIRWYIVENNKEQIGIYEMLIPDEIVEKLKL